MAQVQAGSIVRGVGLLAVLSFLLVCMLWRPLMQTQPDRVRVVQHLQFMAVRTDLATSVEDTEDAEDRRIPRAGAPMASDNYCSRVERWFPNQTYPETQLVFFGKPIMQAVRSICIERRWKMKLILNDSPFGVSELDKLLSPHVFTIAFTSSRGLRHPIVQQLANSSNALVSGIRYAFKTTGAKKGQVQAFRTYLNLFGCSLEDLSIMPPSFLLDEPADCVQFFKYASLHSSSYWVLKPSHGYGGDGIAILPNLTRLHREFGTCQGKEEYVVQEYLLNLLLIEGRKFDVRALVLIAGTNPYILFHHDGYLRVSVKQFDLNGGRAVHLTNSHVQVFSTGFKPDKHFWSFQRFQQYLDSNHPDNEDFVRSRLVPFIKKISLFILQTGRCPAVEASVANALGLRVKMLVG